MNVSRPASRMPAFTVLELLIVIGIIALLIGILLPAVEKVRHQAYIDNCASNLRQIGQAMVLYANDHHGQLPRTQYDPTVVSSGPTAGNDGAKTDPFSTPPYVANDVTRAMFLLVRTQRIPTTILFCPYNDVYTYEADRADPLTRSNFTDYKKNLGYGMANPYPGAPAEAAGYLWKAPLASGFALAADVAPPGSRPAGFSPGASSRILNAGNSRNHENDGQNVLYGDGHVAWNQTVYCGENNDDIYTANNPAPTYITSKDDSWIFPVGQ